MKRIIAYKVILTPQNFGTVRIVNAEGTIRTLVANNGSSFSFDAADQKFISTVAGNSVTRSIGAGTKIESGKVQYQLEGFEFINQWRYNVEGVGTITIFAGNEQSDTHKGVLLLFVSPPDDDSKVLEKVSYRTNLEDGALRSIDVEGEVLTLEILVVRVGLEPPVIDLLLSWSLAQHIAQDAQCQVCRSGAAVAPTETGWAVQHHVSQGPRLAGWQDDFDYTARFAAVNLLDHVYLRMGYSEDCPGVPMAISYVSEWNSFDTCSPWRRHPPSALGKRVDKERIESGRSV